MRKIVIVGGGAGGLELAARLSRHKLHRKKFTLTLIDNKLKHVWKPLLHEVAMGKLMSFEDEVDYFSYAAVHHFQFEYGYVEKLDRQQKKVMLAAIVDDRQKKILPERTIHYDFLIFAIGSTANDFHIPGVKENCFFLDTLYQAENLNKTLMQEIIRSASLPSRDTHPFHVAIIGAGATGVELAAEMHHTFTEVSELTRFSKKMVITILESADRVLPQLPKRISTAAAYYLSKIGIKILTNELVTRVTDKGIETKQGKFVTADIVIWSAGIKVDPITKQFDGLALNKINQIKVNEALQTEDKAIFAIGDCASFSQKNNQGDLFPVPPRAQAANQQASLLAKSLVRHLNGKPLLAFKYHDYGSLITISRYKTLGSLMFRIAKNLYIEGLIARFTYWLLYKKHQAILWGTWRVTIMTFANGLTSRIRGKLKLH